MRVWFAILASAAAFSCGPPPADEPVVEGSEARRLCRYLSDHERVCWDGDSELTMSVDFDECLDDSIPQYEACGLTHGQVRGCADALDTCEADFYDQRDGSWYHDDCKALFTCENE